jgi:CBS domain-containing protein
MNRDVRWIYSDASVLEAATMMRDFGVGFLPVCDRKTKLVTGVVTDRDVVVRLCATNGKPSEVKVADVSTPEPVVCSVADDIKRVEDLMTENDIARVLAVDENGKLVGVISLTNILMEEPSWRALRTARKVLEREAMGPKDPPQTVRLTKSKEDGISSDHEQSAVEIRDHSSAASDRVDASVGGETRGLRTFPG